MSTTSRVSGALPNASPDRPTPAERQVIDALTAEQFRHAADTDGRRANIGDVVEAHLWIADSVARRYRGHGEEDDDLLQVARVGLVEACLRFDQTKGAFPPFAFATVSGVVKRHFRDHSWAVRPPRRTQELSIQMWKAWPAVAQAMGAEPSEQQLAATLGGTVDEVRLARDALQSFNFRSVEELFETPTDDDSRERERVEARLLVTSAWCHLTEAEQQLLVMRFYDDRRQRDIASELGVSQMQVSRLLDRLLAKLLGIIGSPDDPVPATA